MSLIVVFLLQPLSCGTWKRTLYFRERGDCGQLLVPTEGRMRRTVAFKSSFKFKIVTLNKLYYFCLFFRLSSICVIMQSVMMRPSLWTQSASSRSGGSVRRRLAGRHPACTSITRTASSPLVWGCEPVWGRGWRRWRCTLLCPG